MFHNRTNELQDLRGFISSRRSELVIIYGRRGVGKTALVREAIRDQHHLIYQATTQTLPLQMVDMTAALRSFAPHSVLPGVLPGVRAFLDALAQLAGAQPERPVIVVIDELPYLAGADPAVPSEIQRWWDEIRRAEIKNLKLFLLGSMVSWMEEHTLSEHAPLYNRRTGQIMLGSMGYQEAALFYPSYSAEERIAAYAIWGGMPSYLVEVDPDMALWDNVLAGLLQPASRLAEEPGWLRYTDLRSDMIYSSILRAIANKERRPSDIAKTVGRDSANDVLYPLDRLIDLGLVRRVIPIHEEAGTVSRRPLYSLNDHYIAFWYRYVSPLRNLLALRRSEEALEVIKEDFDKYVSELAFEDVARQFIQSLPRERLPGELRYERVGSWWTSQRDRSQAPQESDEIDVVAMHDRHASLLGECKWSKQKMDKRDLSGLRAALLKATSDLKPIDNPWRALFSRSGFTDDVIALSKDPGERILLYTPEDIYGATSAYPPGR